MSTQETKETWCLQCSVHLALPHQPLCPGCLQDEARRLRDEARRTA